MQQLNTSTSNPFVGLRPFESTESLLFFGRSSQTGELLERLHFNRFVSVVGRSGCGKSSLIRAGLIPKLQAGFLLADRDRWLVSTMKPGDRPLRNLASALLETVATQPSLAEINSLVEGIGARGVEVLVQALKPVLDETDSSLLLLVDQFEEIFRFGSHGRYDPDETDHAALKSRDEAADFVAMMLALAEQREIPVYVVMTMRSDFLGDCDTFYGLPEAMNRSQYLVPRLSTQQREEAISGPIRLSGQMITPGLLDLVRNDVGDKLDQLPVMQHAMMRTWDNWSRREVGPIDVPHYRAAGTIKNALSEDAEGVLRGLNEKQGQLAMHIFQALTDTDSENRRIRRPVHLEKLQAITGAGRKEIMEIVEAFQIGGRAFLTVSPDKLGGNDLIDISHESLIRQWHTLRDWVDQEADDRATYLRIAQAAALYQKKKGGLWDDPDLQSGLDWWNDRKPTRAWAEQYHPASGVKKPNKSSGKVGDEKVIDIYTEAENFLKESRRARDQEIADKEMQRRREQNLKRLVVLVIAGALLLLAGSGATFGVYATRKQYEAEHQKDIAEEQKGIAETQTRLAEYNLVQAEESQRSANEARGEADKQKLEAEKARDDAETAKNDALKQERIAKENATKAAASARIAIQQKEIAENLIYTSDMKLVQYGEEEGDSARSRKWLERYLPKAADTELSKLSSPGKKQKNDRRAYEWYYFWRLNHRDAPTLKAKEGGVSSLAFSPDGKLASAYENGSIKLWDAAAEKELTSVPFEFSPSSVAFQKDGKKLAIGGDNNTVYILDVPSGGKPTKFGELQSAVRHVAFSPDGKMLAATGNNELKLWDVESGKELPKFVRKQASTKPEDVKTEKSEDDPFDSIGTIAFSPDGKQLAVSKTNVVELWDLNSNHTQEPTELKVEEDQSFFPIYSVAFSPNSEILAASDSEGSVVLFDLTFNVRTANFKAHDGAFVTSMAFSPDGKTIATGGTDDTAKLWDVASQEKLITLPSRGGAVVIFSNDGHTLATGSKDGTVKLWDAALLKDYLEPLNFGGDVIYAAYSPNSQIVAALSASGVIKLMNANSYTELPELSRPTGEPKISAIAFSPDSSRLAVGDTKGTVFLYDTASWKELAGETNKLSSSAKSRISSLVFSPKGSILAVSSGDLITLWHIGREGKTDFKGRAPIAFSEDGNIVAAANEDETVRLWDVIHQREIGATRSNSGEIKSVVFSPGDKTLAVSSNDEDVRLWDLGSLKARKEIDPVLLEGHRGKGVYCVAFSPDGRTIATGGVDNTVRLWSAITYRELATLKAHRKPVLSLAFSPDSRTLVSGGEDSSLKVWRGAGNREVLEHWPIP